MHVASNSVWCTNLLNLLYGFDGVLELFSVDSFKLSIFKGESQFLFSVFLKNNNLLLFISSFLEVSGACATAAEYRFTVPIAALFAANFAVSFGGPSVHMQAMLFFEGGRFPLARYLLAKLAQGAIASLLLFLFLPII